MAGLIKSARAILQPIHRHIFLACSLLVMSIRFSVATEDIIFTVKADAVVISCSVVAGDEEQTIKMGDIDATQLESSGQSNITFFTIHLERCTEATKLAKVTFNSQHPDGDGWFYPADGQDSWGYKLGLTNSQGVHIPLGISQNMPTSGPENTLEFGVVVAKTNGTLRLGDFSAIATATISYE